jgi:hypothetical protein
MKPVETVPIPGKMRLLQRDRRGYPVPWIVQRDLDGRPFFVINDTERVSVAARRKVCGICGQKLERENWLIGGPGAAFHEHGAFLDPPMHKACATYALRVCPYIAGRYTKRVDEALAKFGRWPPGIAWLSDESMIPEQPPFFVLARARRVVFDQEPGERHRFRPERPWLAVEFWKDGVEIGEGEARERLAASEKWVWNADDLAFWPRSVIGFIDTETEDGVPVGRAL